MPNAGDFSGCCILKDLRTLSRFKKIKGNLLSDVHVLHKTLKFL